MAIQIKGTDITGGYIADVDSNNNLIIIERDSPWPTSGGTSGGFYTVAGQTSAVVAASLAANTTLATLRFSSSSSRKAYLTRFRIAFVPSTLAVSALVPGTIGLQRFNTATPTGGTARVVNRQSNLSGNTSDMTDIRDSNAALTVTNVAFGTVVSNALIPLFINGGSMWYEWIFEPIVPVVLNPGDGISLRVQVSMPATQTWTYSYTAHWYEK